MNKNTVSIDNPWKDTNIQVFWREIAHADHVLQIYESEKRFLDTLEGFAGTGFLEGDSVIIIATRPHIHHLNERLQMHGFNLGNLFRSGRYFPLDANETLSKFMINNRPDEALFESCIPQLIEQAAKDNRKVRAFGEMVALLWERGLYEATQRLEELWNNLRRKKNFTLFCAYPKSSFVRSSNASIEAVCKAHSKIIDGQPRPSTEIYYNELK